MSTLTKTRGYNAVVLPWRGYEFPNDLCPTPGAPKLSYEEFFSALESAGVNVLRVKFTGWQRPPHTESLSLEPPPVGTFNPWADDLDPGNLTEYRSRQVSGAMSPDLWQRSNLGKLVTSAENHGVKLHVILFDNEEWRTGWPYHAWNANNRYINGQACQQQDRGFLSSVRDVFTHPRAIAAAKARIDFILKAVEGHDVVSAWELCAEMTWMLTPDFWGVTWNEFEPIILNQAVPWVEDMASYLKARHPAPVCNGHVFAPGGFTGGRATRNEVYRTPSLDFALINWYGDGPLEDKVSELRAAQQFIGKPVYVEQYAPWSLSRDAVYTREAATFPESKAHEWAAACGEYGFVGPMRWPEVRGEFRTWWGIAHPNMAEIAGITRQMANCIDLADWKAPGASFDNNITSTGLTLKSSWGDGEHVTMFLRWSSVGAKTITVDGLKDQDYRFFLYDWITGNQISTRDVTATGGKLVLSQVSTKDGAIAGYLAPSRAPRPVASFSGEPASGERPLTVQFSDSSQGPITSWSWSFGDSSTSTERNPSHTYDTAGTYTVALSVDGPGGTDTRTRINYVTVTDPKPIPMIRLLFDDGDPTTQDITVDLRANITYRVETSTFEQKS